MRRTVGILVSCIAAVAAACTEPPAPRGPRPDLVVFLIDTLRADHLGAYGYARDTTPYLDAKAANGLLFENVIAQAPWTAPSMASIWTATYPSQAGVHAVEGADGIRHIGDLSATKLRAGAVTLAAVLADAGYDTLALSTNVYASDRFGLLSGFAHKTHSPGKPADDVVDAALAALDRHVDPRRPFFLYVHFMDLHEPTRPPAPYRDRYPTLDGKPHERRHQTWSFGRGEGLDTEAFAAYRSHKLALYDGALRFVDDEIARFAAEMDERGLSSNTVFVVASDHGEEFWDNVAFERQHSLDPRGVYGIGHGHSMSREVLHVPLLMWGPGVPAARVSQQVRNLDVAPSVLGLAGISAAEHGMHGIDLISALEARRLKPLVAFSEDIAYGAEQKSAQTARRQYVRHLRARTARTEFLFKKTLDRRATVLVEEGAAARRLARVANVVSTSAAAPSGATFVPDARALAELRALGYLE